MDDRTQRTTQLIRDSRKALDHTNTQLIDIMSAQETLRKDLFMLEIECLRLVFAHMIEKHMQKYADMMNSKISSDDIISCIQTDIDETHTCIPKQLLHIKTIIQPQHLKISITYDDHVIMEMTLGVLV